MLYNGVMRTEEEYQKLYQSRYKLQKKYKQEVIDNHEREERNKKTRLDLMMENKRLVELYDDLQVDFRKLLVIKETVDNRQNAT